MAQPKVGPNGFSQGVGPPEGSAGNKPLVGYVRLWVIQSTVVRSGPDRLCHTLVDLSSCEDTLVSFREKDKIHQGSVRGAFK
jgi:hypothetical protein